MFTKRTKLVMGVALFLSILCCLLSCASVGITMTYNYIANSPQEARSSDHLGSGKLTRYSAQPF